MAYPDDFNRADGGLGAGWSVYSGSMSISGNRVTAATPAYAQAAGQSESGDQSHYIVIPIVGGAIKEARVILKKDSDSGDCWWAAVSMNGASLRVSVGYWFGVTDHQSAYTDTSMPGGASLTLTGTFTSTTITATVGATTASTANDHGYDSQSGFGFAITENDGLVDAFDAEGGTPATMQVTPDPVWVGGGEVELEAELSGATWDPEDQGSTQITADHGSVTWQRIVDTTHILIIYEPAEYLGPITFTDSSTEAEDTINSTLAVPEGFQVCQLTEAGADLVNRSGEANALGTILTTIDELPMDVGSPVNIITGISWIFQWMRAIVGGVEPSETSSGMLSWLWFVINGAQQVTGEIPTMERNTTLKQEAEEATDHLRAIRTENDRTLQDVIDYLQGDPLYTLESLHTDIVGITAPDNQEILDAIAAVRGYGAPDLTTILGVIDILTAGSTLDLGDINTAIANIPTTDLSGVMDKLDAIQPSETFTLSSIETQATSASVAAVAAETALGVLTGDGELTLQTILDALALLSDKVDAMEARTAPVWPGAASVTLGTPVALSNGMTITDDMDGVIVAVTTPPTRTGLYQIGSESYDYGVGRIAFESDGGELEPWQYLGFRAALFTPKSMRRASKVHLQVLGGAEGTVTPWITSE